MTAFDGVIENETKESEPKWADHKIEVKKKKKKKTKLK